MMIYIVDQDDHEIEVYMPLFFEGFPYGVYTDGPNAGLEITLTPTQQHDTMLAHYSLEYDHEN